MLIIITIPLKDMKPDDSQPRKYFDQEAMDRLTQSIKDNGIESPITVRENGKAYIIVDGERRWRAAKSAGLKDLPCIITEKEDILEQQLRSECLKENLTVDELDKAIYRYYEHYVSNKTSFVKNSNRDEGYKLIGNIIGKSAPRIRKAIDRFEFKRDNEAFTKKIEKEHNPTNKRYSNVDSTIAMTDKLKDKPEVRKAVIEEILDSRKTKAQTLNNEKIKKAVDNISKRDIKPAAAKEVIRSIVQKEKEDIGIVYERYFGKILEAIAEFDRCEFIKYPDHLNFTELIDCLDEFIQELREANK